MYESKIRDVIACMTFDQTFENSKEKNIFEKIKLKFAQKTIEAISFVNAKVKIYYDIKHKSLLLNSKNETFIRFHHEYKLSKQINKKLKNQKCDPFKVLRRVKKLAYEMNLPRR